MIYRQISKSAIGNTGGDIRSQQPNSSQLRAIAGNNLTPQDIMEAMLQALLQSRNHRLSESTLL